MNLGAVPAGALTGVSLVNSQLSFCRTIVSGEGRRRKLYQPKKEAVSAWCGARSCVLYKPFVSTSGAPLAPDGGLLPWRLSAGAAMDRLSHFRTQRTGFAWIQAQCILVTTCARIHGRWPTVAFSGAVSSCGSLSCISAGRTLPSASEEPRTCERVWMLASGSFRSSGSASASPP